MSLKSHEIYQSSSGDRWLLVRDSVSGEVMVKHEPNLASGGRESVYQLGEFLSRDLHTPERQQLIQLIGTLAAEAAEADPR